MTAQAVRRYVILGSGVAGIAAAQAIRSVDATGDVTVITEDGFGYYSRPGLAYYLSGEVAEDMLFPFQRKDFRSLNLRWVKAKAVRIHARGHKVELADGAMLPYDRMLIATGSMATPLSAPGAALKGVYKLDNMDDAQAILKGCRRARTAVVVGGGITALELVEGLRARGLQVHYFLRGDRYWSNVLDEVESAIIQDRLAHEGVRLHFHTELAEINGRNGQVAGVTTRDGNQIRCELVAFAIGIIPRVELAKAAGLAIEKGISADETLRSSDPDIFAAGDAAQVLDPFTGKTGIDTLWNTARQQGHVAGLNMAGQVTAYQKYVPFNVTRLAGLTTTIIGTVGKGVDPSLTGIARGDSETWRQLPDAMVAEHHFEVNRLRLVIGPKTIQGAVAMGDQALSIPLQGLIGQRVDIAPIRERLLASDRLAETILDFWENWRTDHALQKS